MNLTAIKSPVKARNALKYDFLDDIHPEDRVKVLAGIYGAEDKVRFLCNVCGEYYFMRIISYRMGNRHLKCSAQERGKKSRKRDYDFLHEVREDYRKKIKQGKILSTEKVPFICDKHGEYWQILASHQRGNGCPQCGIIKSKYSQRTVYDFDDLREDYKEKVRQKQILSHDKVPFICKVHGEYWQTLTAHEKGIGCPQCGIEKSSLKRRKQDYSIYHQLRDDYKEKVDNLEITSKDDAVFVCKKHGEYTRQIGDANFHSVKGRTACPVCNLAFSPYSLFKFLKTVADKVIVNDRRQIAPLEIDFYLPDYKIGFEFNDIRSHQTLFEEQEICRDNYGGKPSKYHYDKYMRCKKQGIRLIQIWDTEWSDERINPILKSVIKNALGLNENKVYARNCELVKSGSKECNPFFLKNHIQGKARGNGYFALKYKGEIVGAICYTDKIKLVKRHNNNNADITISRMCFKQNTSVVGGASRLLKAVTDTMEKGQTIEYLVLNDYFDGVSFEKTGWEKAKWYPMVRYYDKEKEYAYYRAPSKYIERKEKCLDGRMYRYYTSGTTVYRKKV